MPAPLPANAPPGFHLLAKPSGSTCNIDCTYCFFLSKESLYPNDKHRMSEATLEVYIRQLLESHRAPQVTVAWQGGEPTLMKLDFFRRSVELDPGYTFARIPFGICLMSEGRFAEAVAQLDSAHMADPLDAAPSNVLGRVYVSAHQPDLAIRQLSAALELNPLFDLAYQQLAHAYVQKRMYPAAVAAMRRAAELSGIRDSAQLAYVYAVSGARDDAAQLMRLLVGQPSDRYLPPYHIAMAYAGLGNADSAFLWLDRAYAERASFMGGVKVEPGFATLHSDPRWRVLLVRMGLTGSE
jgi:tetratricopeptide (TPR) repeat protein